MMETQIVTEKMTMRAVDDMKWALFGAAYAIQDRNIFGERFFYFNTLICALQLTHFPFAPEIGYPWSPALLNIIQPMTSALNFGYWNFSSDWALVGLGLGFLLWLGLTTFFSVLIGIDSVHKSSGYKSFIPLVGVSLNLQKGAFQLPIIGTFFRILRGRSGLSSTAQISLISDSSLLIVFQVLAVVGLMCHFVTSMLSSLLLITHTPYRNQKVKESKSLASPHGRADLVSTFCKAVIGTVVAVTASFETPPETAFENTQYFLVIILICLVVTAVLIIWVYLYYLPFYQVGLSWYMVVTHSVYLWASICAVIAYSVRREEDYGSFFVFAVALPFFCFSVGAMVHHRRQRLANVSDAILMTPYLVELHLRLKFQRDTKNFAFSGDAETSYKAAVTAFPRSAFLCLYVAAISTGAGNKIIYSLHLIKQAGQCTLQLDTEYFLYTHNRINEERQSHLAGAVSFMALDRHLESAKESMMRTLKSISQFWRKVAHAQCKLNDLLTLGVKVHEEAAQCKFHLQKLVRMSDSHTEGQRLQATFFHYVMNDKRAATRIMQSLQLRATDHSGGYAVCTISGNWNTLGQIMDASHAMCSFFGYSKSDLVGRSVNIIMPSPFDKIHDDFIKHFLSTDADFSTQTRRIYGIHRKGYIMPVDFVLTPSTNAQSDLILIGKIGTDVHVPPNQYVMIVEAKSGIVTSATQDCPDILGVDQQDLFTMAVNIVDLIPDFFLDSRILKYKEEAVARINYHDFRVKATLVDYSRAAISCAVIMVKLTMLEDSYVNADPRLLNLQHQISADQLYEPAVAREHEETVYKTRVQLPDKPGGTQQTFAFSMSGNKQVGRKGGDRGSMASSLDEDEDIEISRIQRKINADLNKKDPRLKRFTKFTQHFIVAFIILIAIQSFLGSKLYTLFLSENEECKLAHDSAHHIVLAAILTFYTVFIDSNTSKVERSTIINLLTESTASLKSNHEALLAAANSAMFNTSVLDDAISVPKHVEYIDANSSRFVNYQVIVLDYVNNLEKFVSEELQTEGCSDACKFILNNGPFEVLESTLEMASLYEERAKQGVKRLYSFDVISNGVVLVILLSAFAIGYAPLLLNHGRRKRAIGKAFVAIPEKICRVLHSRTERRLRVMQMENEEGRDPNDDVMESLYDSEDEEEDQTINKVFEDEQEKRKRPGIKKRSSFLKRTWSLRGSSTDPTRQIHSDSCCVYVGNILNAILRIGITFWLVFGFLVFTTHRELLRQEKIYDMHYSVYLSGLRYVERDTIQFWGVKSGSFDWERSNIETVSSQLLGKTLDEIYSTNFKLLYGNAENSATSFRSTNGNIFGLYYGDYCGETCVEVYTRNDPQLLTTNDFRQGIMFALESFVRSGRRRYVGERWTNVDQMNLTVLEPHLILSSGLNEATSLYSSDLETLVGKTNSEKMKSVFILIGILIFANLVSLHAVSRMDKELKKTQTLLLMLPGEVFAKVPAITKLLRSNTSKSRKR